MNRHSNLIAILSALALLVTAGTALAQANPQSLGLSNAHDRAMRALELRDYRSAYSLFSDMARQGDPDGLFHLGVMHENGQGVPRNIKEAYARFYLAGRQGHQTAAQYARDLQVSMPPDESAAIRSRVLGLRSAAMTPRSAQPRTPVSQPRLVRPYRPAVGTPPIRSER